MNEIRIDTRTVALLLLAWLIYSKREPLKVVAQGFGDIVRGGGGKTWREELTG